MLEFYNKFYPKLFKKKSKKLATEISKVFKESSIKIIKTNEQNIPAEYREDLGDELFEDLNNLYFTLRFNNGEKNALLRKYLPECKHLPDPNSQLLFADFFSGAGGLGQGLVNAGFVPAFVNDIYLEALETYYFNHNLCIDRFFNNDISDIVYNIQIYLPMFEGVTIIAGGPPCQGFSTANRWNFKIDTASQEKRFIEDERNILYKHFVQLLGFIKPDFFIMENVRGMKKAEEQIEQDIKVATDEEYFFSPLVLDAQRFNIPQSRVRYILIGGKSIFKIEQIKTGILNLQIKTSDYKLQDALFGLPKISANPIKLNADYESEINGFNVKKTVVPQNNYLRSINKNPPTKYLWNHRSRFNNDNDLEIFRRLPEGGNSLHESIQDILLYKNREHIFKDKYYKLKKNEVSKTITSHMKYDCHMYIHPEQPRGLSPREAARIQTFPDDYVFRGTLNSWYKQIGNAVPVKLGEIIANEIKYYI